MHLRQGFASQGVAAKPGHRQCATPIHYAPIAHLHSGRGRPVCVRGLARDILTAQAGQIEGDPLAFLDVTEAYWKALRLSKDEPERKGPTVVTVDPQGSLDHMDFDVILCGGTLGLMVAATLQRRGHRVAVVDKRLIQGRTQEWNISKGELMSLAHVGLLTEEELNSCIVSEFNPVRVGFAGGPEMWVNDCLNLGVSPRKLLDLIKAKFVEAGGVLMENHSFRSAEVVPGQGVRLTLSVGGGDLGPGDVNRPNGLGGNSSNMVGPFTPVDSTGATPSPARIGRRRLELNCQLLVDCMGHYSDVVKQMRGRAKPDGMCIVVGSCAEGFPSANNTFGDLLYTIDDAKDDMQMFWEAFPAEGGAARTTYMFSYSDAEPSRPNFETLLDEYLENLHKYQGVHANDLQFKRVLFGGFPCWNDGPLQPAWDHIVQVGDASATQSPLSFGGFGAMLRHLGRLTEGMDDALRCGALSRDELKCLHPYQPSLSCSWLFQRSMSIGVGQLHKATQQQQQQQQQQQLTAGEPSTALARGALATAPPAFVQLPVNHVNEVLGVNFGVMKVLGDRVLRPFLQDTIQLLPLSLSMAGMMLANPIAITRVLFQVGPETLLSWFGHYFALVAYTTLHHLSTPVRQAVRGAAGSSQNSPDAQALRVVSGGTHESLRHSTDAGRSRSGYKLRRLLDAWEVGSGSDHAYHAASEPPRPPSDTFFRLPQLPPAKAAPAVAATAAASQGQGPAVLAPATVMMSQTQPEVSQRY